MVNRQRGEVEAVLDGRPWTLCLTLGALAELEAALATGDLMGLARRFEEGTLAAADAIRIIGAGLRGAGNDIDDATVARMQADGGAAGYVAIVAELLSATFGGGEEPKAALSVPRKREPSVRKILGPRFRGDQRKGCGVQRDEPFPWRQAMAFGFGRLRLSSAAFWAMTPRELAAAAEGAAGASRRRSTAPRSTTDRALPGQLTERPWPTPPTN